MGKRSEMAHSHDDPPISSMWCLRSAYTSSGLLEDPSVSFQVKELVQTLFQLEHSQDPSSDSGYKAAPPQEIVAPPSLMLA